MPYGIDTDCFEYVTDAHGKRVKALVPVSTLNALVEFWCAARRAQSDAHEVKARPGLRPAPLRVMMPSLDDPPPLSVSVPFASDERWRKLTEKLPDTPASPASPASLEALASPAHAPAPSPHKLKSKHAFFPREFIAPLPDEVALKIAAGVYFVRAWRQYRRLSLQDVADLIGKTKAVADKHEYGYSVPHKRTLQRYAEVFDCTIEQLTVKPKSNTAPWLDVIKGTKPDIEPRSPEGTDYPTPVLAHLLDGKSPLTAWRLHRRMTVAQLADAYGTGQNIIKEMEARLYLKPKVIGKLCVIFGCTPGEMLRPESFECMKADAVESPASRRITEAMRASA